MDIFRFEVFFTNENKVTIPGISQTNPLHVPEGLSLITFTLINTSGVEFASNPIQWLQDGVPADLPPWIVVHRHDARHLGLWDFNSNPKTHNFELSVFHENRFFSTDDPSIVNDPPSG